MQCAFGLSDRDIPETTKIVNGVVELVKDAAEYLYGERGKVWDEAMGLRSFAESGLAYDIHGGCENEVILVCKRVLRRACQPNSFQDKEELAIAVAEKKKEDAWKRELGISIYLCFSRLRREKHV